MKPPSTHWLDRTHAGDCLHLLQRMRDDGVRVQTCITSPPYLLITPCVLAGSRVGDTVLDPFMGSGTTAVVALQHQRHFIGCELVEAFIAQQRLHV